MRASPSHWITDEQRDAILVALEDAGREIHDPSGLATRQLYEMLGDAFPHPLKRLSDVLQQFEKDGIVTRSTLGRRTHLIALNTGKTVRTRVNAAKKRSVQPPDEDEITFTRTEIQQAREEPEPSNGQVPASVDLDLREEEEFAERLEETAAPRRDLRELADTLLARCAEILAHPPAPVEPEIRYKVDPKAVEVALNEAEHQWRKARDEITGAAELAIKDAEEKAADLEKQMAVLNVRIQSQDEEIIRLRGILRKYRDQHERDRPGYPIRELVDEESLKVIDQLMKEPPRQKENA